jgi:hypothetical protein
LSANGILFLVASHQPVEVEVIITQVEAVFSRKVAVPFAFFYNDTDGTVIQYLERRVSGVSLVDATFRNPSFAIVLAYVNGYVLAGSLAGWE